MVRAKRVKSGSCPPGQQGETQTPRNWQGNWQGRPGAREGVGGVTENVSFGGPANGQALSLEWGIQNGGALGPTH